MYTVQIIQESHNNQKIKVSILVSTYNKSQFIEKTIHSLAIQTMNINDFELIVVDDCSTDDTLKLVKEATADFPNHKVIQLDVNSGTPAEPRNTAIDVSVGKYLMFIDGDDWLPTDSVEKLYNLISKNNTDYAAGLTQYMYDERAERRGVAVAKIAYDKVDPYKIKKIFSHLAPPGRIIRSTIVKDNDIRFPSMIFGEDLQFFAEVFFNVDKISTTTDVVYYANRYGTNDSLVKSATSTQSNRMALQMNAYRYLLAKYKQHQLFPHFLDRIVNKDILAAKFYDKAMIKETDDKLLLALEAAVNEIDQDFDTLKITSDALNYHAIELLRSGDESRILKFVKWYAKKDKDSQKLVFKNKIAYYKYDKNLYKKQMYAALESIHYKNGYTTLELMSKNADLQYLEIKNRKNPSDFVVLPVQRKRFKPGQFTVEIDQASLPIGRLAVTVLDADLNSVTVTSNDYFNMYRTIGGNLGLVNTP